MPTLIEVEADVEDIADPRGFVPIPVGNVTTYAESSVGLSLVSAALRLIERLMRFLTASTFCLYSCLTLSPALADTLTGRVIGISDGDTFTLLTANQREVKIRLAEIDAPEKAQPYGTKSRQALSVLAYGKAGTDSGPDHRPIRASGGPGFRSVPST
ncbi:thermonuclease family protein [uncultured Thiocystis sp.]|uniref:thermonuclease family protein n=1 Tax=uncultured Thiocystis sp. TaxID=1202134 RepID=UPI0025EBB99D|nr:thermonuclease family protein [uncultured Thiocystis sp.]